MKTGLLIVTAFVIFFLFLWNNILALLSFIGGWRRLSIESPAPDTAGHGDVQYSFQTMRLGFVNYKGCIRVRFTPAGMVFSTIWPFTFMHSPFIIRYDKISGIKTGNFFGPYVEFTAEEKKLKLTGKSAVELEKRMNITPGGSRTE